MRQEHRADHRSAAAGRRDLSRSLAALGLVLAVLILATVPLWWSWGRPGTEVGSLASLASSGAAQQRGTHRGPAVVPSARSVHGLWNDRIHSGLLDRFRQRAKPVPPVRLRAPAIGVDAPVVPVGVHSVDGAMDVPVDVSRVGWYRYSAQPGKAGSSVVIGHVDSRAQGIGAFFRLRDLMPGASVFIRLADGTNQRFAVVARREYRKEALPPRIFARSGRPILTLVTCGGPFDQATGHYLDNVVVFALPARPGG